MDKDTVIETEIEGVFIIKRPVFSDNRGFFRETFRRNELEEKTGYNFNIVQQNHSRSTKGTLRGIHVAPWAKLVTILRGEVFQVVVDLRRDSPTFLKHVALDIGESNFVQLFIPPGCGNGYQVLSDEVDYSYSVDKYWFAGAERGLAYDDEKIGIEWREGERILSEKDLRNPKLEEFLKGE